MESFSMDLADDDLKGLWDTDPLGHTSLDAAEEVDWGSLLEGRSVILHDRMITDAAFGTLPIKHEHSYSLNSDSDSESTTFDDKLGVDDDDMESECFPVMPMNQSCGVSESSVFIKNEPRSGASSPEPGLPAPTIQIKQGPEKAQVKPITSQQQSLLKQQTIVFTSRPSLVTNNQNKMVFPRLNLKVEPSAGFSLPPTPPSSTTSDCEGGSSPIYHPCLSPVSGVLQRQSSGGTKLVLSTQRNPIQTPLISQQPKGATGFISLTEEEKRTLLSEGYPVPTRLPLTKSEEKSLKKIRRKIKNKISAQESRRKKKEYMDTLEKRVEVLSEENMDYRRKVEVLEKSNSTLVRQVAKLKTLLDLQPEVSDLSTDSIEINISPSGASDFEDVPLGMALRSSNRI